MIESYEVKDKAKKKKAGLDKKNSKSISIDNVVN